MIDPHYHRHLAYNSNIGYEWTCRSIPLSRIYSGYSSVEVLFSLDIDTSTATAKFLTHFSHMDILKFVILFTTDFLPTIFLRLL
mmetsp:Transcript_95717/g.194555  ORF Transcript_95717/g.194555 Transcript_95717/m.194555 type:complete len:84 (+) Transcript_95717:537-788(+)